LMILRRTTTRTSITDLCPATLNLSYSGDLDGLPETWLDLSRDKPKVKQNYKRQSLQSHWRMCKATKGMVNRSGTSPENSAFVCVVVSCMKHMARTLTAWPAFLVRGDHLAPQLTLTALRQLFGDMEPTNGQPDPRKLLGLPTIVRMPRYRPGTSTISSFC
jgi:hypothetical protein